jgi:hypothetical protein
MGKWVFPRGQACCGKAVSTGPVGQDGASGYFSWNGDGTYADWYAAHEIGHTLGRAHPVTKGSDAANRKCGQSEDDSGYPYDYAQIGSSDDTEGFDAGDASLKQPKRVYPGTQWTDVMSYCAEQWLSDYTYEAMYQFMTTAAAEASQAPDAVSLSGDWLSVQGTIISGTNTASINRVRRLSSVASLPPLVPGGYAIRLLNASNGQLANYLFSGQRGPAGRAQPGDRHRHAHLDGRQPGRRPTAALRHLLPADGQPDAPARETGRDGHEHPDRHDVTGRRHWPAARGRQ